ncbi:MAG: hypothetical protein ISS78_02670 [Phycisphaerae bacterium]|nr:hypothetical protein [Phycisphaerae bacterium]
MRIGFSIILLAAITVSQVHIRRREVRARYRTHQLDREAVALRRQLGNQQLRLGELTTPRVVWRRSGAMALGLIDADSRERHLASRRSRWDHDGR